MLKRKVINKSNLKGDPNYSCCDRAEEAAEEALAEETDCMSFALTCRAAILSPSVSLPSISIHMEWFPHFIHLCLLKICCLWLCKLPSTGNQLNSQTDCQFCVSIYKTPVFLRKPPVLIYNFTQGQSLDKSKILYFVMHCLSTHVLRKGRYTKTKYIVVGGG